MKKIDRLKMKEGAKNQKQEETRKHYRSKSIMFQANDDCNETDFKNSSFLENREINYSIFAKLDGRINHSCWEAAIFACLKKN